MTALHTAYANVLLDQYRAYVRETAQARLLPYRCHVCGARANHNGEHWTPDGGSMCRALPMWDCDRPEPK